MAAKNEFTITRVFQAPRELVFNMFMEAEHLKHWWGPKGFTIRIFKFEARLGGVFHYSMIGTDGYVMWGKNVYKEIQKVERIVFVNSFSDKEGNTARAPFSETFPMEVLSTLLFTEDNGKTILNFRAIPLHATQEEHKSFEDMFPSMQQGYGSTFDTLEKYINQNSNF